LKEHAWFWRFANETTVPYPGRGNHGKPLHHGGHWRGSRPRKSRGPVLRRGHAKAHFNGRGQVIDLPQDAAEIFVADPAVANAVVRSPRKLYVIGVAAGQTSVFALDQQGRKIAALELSIGRGDPGDLQQILRAAMPAAAITARTINDTIILTGAVDSIEDAQRATDIANGFVQRLFGAGPSGGPAGGAPGAAAITNGSVVNVLTIRARDQVMLQGDRRGSTARYRQAARDHHKLADRQLGHFHPI
jgi:hypothetical protein